jgi:hypothetical protein
MMKKCQPAWLTRYTRFSLSGLNSTAKYEDVIMTDASHDTGVLYTLVERFNTQRLPRALDLKEKVDAGETLSDLDLQFLEEVFADANQMRPLAERHPEYHDLIARVIHLYKEIMDKALENEKKSS